ncbi:hypothetical protein Acsp03_51050 [Actinomadura sp. NBRC 104412]|nr:hypothetical protein Acsp03_51050 [Actinomadura sp. NBRC 104412]
MLRRACAEEPPLTTGDRSSTENGTVMIRPTPRRPVLFPLYDTFYGGTMFYGGDYSKLRASVTPVTTAAQTSGIQVTDAHDHTTSLRARSGS